MLLITINSLFLVIAVTLACPGSELSVSPPRWKTLGEGNEDSRIHQKVSGVRQGRDATFRGNHKGGRVVTAESASKGYFWPFLAPPTSSSFHTMWCDTQFRAWRNIVQGYDLGPFYVWIHHNSWSKSRFSCSIFGVKTLLCFLFFAFSIPSLTATVKWEGLTATNTHTLFPRIPFQLFFFSFLGSYLKQTRIPFCDISARRDVTFCSFLNLTYFKGKRGAVSHLHFALISQRDRKPLHLRRQFSPNYGDAVSCGWKKKSR